LDCISQLWLYEFIHSSTENFILKQGNKLNSKFKKESPISNLINFEGEVQCPDAKQYPCRCSVSVDSDYGADD